MDRFVNIPQDINNDIHRYKMPTLIVKVEDQGSSLKTKLVNVAEIAKTLGRDATHLVKFFGLELETRVIIQDEYLLNGKYDLESLMVLLDKFITKYVLCGWCQKPDTEFYIEKQSLRIKCNICGQRAKCDSSHPLTSHILDTIKR